MEDLKLFKEELFKAAKEKGFTDFEVYISNSSDLEFTIYESEIDTYNLTGSIGLSFRGIINGKMGNSYTEDISIAVIDTLLTQAMENAKIIESEDDIPIFEGSKEYSEVINYNEEFEKIPVEEKIKFALQLEKYAKERDNRVKSVDTDVFAQGNDKKVIINNKGLNKEFITNYGFVYIGVVVQDGEDIKTAGKLKISNDFKDYDAKQLAYEAVDEAISMLGAKTVKSGEYKVILRNTAFADLIKTFLGIYSAENVQKGLSLLKGKVGTVIASKDFTLVDDPLLPNAIASTPFDGEGVATYKKNIIENGELKTFLYNLKTAKKDGVASTGNGQKGYKSSVGIGAYNLYVQKGNDNYEDLISKAQDGLIITELQGLHSGANAISGDFSLSAKGYLINSGKIGEPVEQITVSGNFYKLLMDIEAIGSDLKFTFPGGANVGAPSITINKLSVAGK